jgi:hypothetical protein
MTRNGRGWRWWRRVEENSVWRGKGCVVEGKGKGEVERKREGKWKGWMDGWKKTEFSVARSVGRWLVRGRGCRLVLLS